MSLISTQHKADGSEEFLRKMHQAQKSWMCKTLKTASPKGNFALTQRSAFLSHPQGHRSARTLQRVCGHLSVISLSPSRTPISRKFAKSLWSPVKLFSCPGGADTLFIKVNIKKNDRGLIQTQANFHHNHFLQK